MQPTPPAPNGVMQGQGNSFIVKISSLGKIQSGPDFSIAFPESTVTVSRGMRIPVVANLGRFGGLKGSVTVTPPALAPKGIKVQGGTVSTTGNTAGSHIKVKASAVPGAYPLTFTGSDKAGQMHSATLTVMVQ
jgi:hypothetical protein